MPTSRSTPRKCDTDVLIVGAGLAGIGMAAHLQDKCPERSFMIVEARDNLGGTWDLFRYPGVRSDSDMQTMSYEFEPWTSEHSLAKASSILAYIQSVVEKRQLQDAIRFNSRVVAANWDSDQALWHVEIDHKGTEQVIKARWLYLGTGYYDYDEPHDPEIPGKADFSGQIVHPQFWPDDFDYSSKRVVVIGSGATAITVVPTMARKAKHVTMLQRTPTYVMSIPSRSWVAKLLHKLLPAELAHRVLRRRNIFLTDFLFRRSRNKPEQMKRFLHRSLKKELGDKYRAEDFSPPYNPWEERMCFISNGDLFRAMREDRASIVTGHIERIEFDGIRLKDGSHLPADIIVTATGLKLAVAGKIAVSVDGSPVEWSQRYFYKNALFSNIPNLSMVVAYLNASATLRMDLVANYVCRVLNHMDEHGYVSATPRIPPGTKLVDHDMFDFSSGYIQRSKHLVPKSSEEYPWKLSHNYRFDRKYMRQSPVEDGCLTFAEPSAKAAHEEALAAQ